MTQKDIITQIAQKRTFLCVGLDSDPRKLPKSLLAKHDTRHAAVMAFNKAIIDATAPHCVAFKPNTAFYEAMGAQGWQVLADTIAYIHQAHPNHFVIADAKRGDIGNTSALYARAFFEEMGADALTVAPYMGSDSVKPFLGYTDKWVILLALTSNEGAADFQLLPTPDKLLFEQVLEKARQWSTPLNMMFVVGATQAEKLARVRRLVPDHFLLVPGIGSQGGSLEEVCRHGMNPNCGLLVNSSRAIIFASDGPDFAEAAAKAAADVSAQMSKMLTLYSKI